MAEETVRLGGSNPRVDMLKRAAYILYSLSAVAFIVGLYFDITRPGEAIIAVLSIANDPSNSGLFVLSILLMVVGYLFSKTGEIVRERGVERVDQTQEWTVDVDRNRN